MVAESDDDPDTPPSALDYVMHAFSLPWKLLFATIPPTIFVGGWVTFVVALSFIGLVNPPVEHRCPV